MSDRHLDAKWFSKYEQIADFDDINYLKFDPEQVKEERSKFLADQSYVPSFNYDIQVERLEGKRQEFIVLKAEIEAEEKNDRVREVYFNKLDEYCGKIDMLLATARSDDAEFFRVSKAVYGEPRLDELKVAVATAINIAKRHGGHVNHFLEEMAVSLKVEEADILPDLDLRAPEGVTMTASEIAERFAEALRGLELSWEVTLSNSAQNIYVDYAQKSIVIPKGREEKMSMVEGLVAHEVNTHLKRYSNGLDSDLLLLSRGLAGYLSNEEGLASYQQLKVSQAHLPGLSLYIGAAVAVGMIDGQPGSFVNVFKSVKAIFELQSLCTGRPTAERVDSEAWRLTVRLYRGINTIGAGRCFTRDASYWQGYINIRSQIENGVDINHLLKGKY